LDETPPFNLLGRGDGVYRFEGVQGLHRFQGALIAKTEEEQDKIIDKLASHWKTNINKDVIDIESSRRKKTERELNEFIKLVLESGETRITELQKIMSVRNEKVKELMSKLIDKGWIRQHKSRAKGFELMLNEEQRKQELERLGDSNVGKN
jgi:S-DNA-T family DNA segregation ATPase FtsK/SpoIIIE